VAVGRTEPARQRILGAAVALIREEGAQSVTVRRVAERAGVGVGLINYHFGSKRNLLAEASSQLLGTSDPPDQAAGDRRLDADTRLRRILRQRLRSLEVDAGLAHLMAEDAVLSGDLTAAEEILVPLREADGGERTEVELRMLALMMWSVETVLTLHAGACSRFLGVDLDQWPGRETALDVLARLTLGRRSG
jgi:AcrR family transcriptional regulator